MYTYTRRFGSFEIFKTQDPVTMRCGPSIGMDHILVQLIDHTIMSYYTKVNGVHVCIAYVWLYVLCNIQCTCTIHIL